MINRGKVFAGMLIASGLTAVSLVATTTATQATDASAFDNLTDKLKAAAAADGSSTPASTTAVDQGIFDKLTKPSPRALVNDPDYWVFNQEYDSPTDSAAYPELGSSALGVSKAYPDLMTVVGLASPYSDGYLTRDGGNIAVLLDTNGDGQSDYGTITPITYMGLSTGYSATIYRFIGSSTVSTGLTAIWTRSSGAWGVSFPWKSMGISGARYVMSLKDQYGDTDWSPSVFGTYAQLAGVVGYVPPPPPPPAPAPVAQSVSGRVPASAKAKRNKKVSLPSTTNAGIKVRWTSQTPKICKISGGKLVSTGKKGKCKISATAASSATRLALNQRYTVKLK